MLDYSFGRGWEIHKHKFRHSHELSSRFGLSLFNSFTCHAGTLVNLMMLTLSRPTSNCPQNIPFNNISPNCLLNRIHSKYYFPLFSDAYSHAQLRCTRPRNETSWLCSLQVHIHLHTCAYTCMHL